MGSAVARLWTIKKNARTQKFSHHTSCLPCAALNFENESGGLTWRRGAGLGMMRRTVRQQGVDAVGLCGDGIHGQLLPEGFFFPPVGKPVVDAHLSDQIGAEALSFGGGHASLKTLSSAGEADMQGEKLNVVVNFFREGTRSWYTFVPVALLHQRLPLLLAGVLLPLVRLVQDLLGRGPPFETVTSHFLAGGFAADIVTRLTLTGGVELWEKKHRILIAFVCHIGAGAMRCLVELCKIRGDTFNKYFTWKYERIIETYYCAFNNFNWPLVARDNFSRIKQARFCIRMHISSNKLDIPTGLKPK